jgi:hypothetical protein
MNLLKALPALGLFFSLSCQPPGQNLPNGVDLLSASSTDQWQVTNFGGEGQVRIQAGELYLGMGSNLTGVTWMGDFPKVEYEVQFEAKRLQGNDFFCGLTFPVNDSFCTLVIGGWGGGTVGLSTIDGKDASENSTSRIMAFQRSQWYKIRLSVAGGRIQAWIDTEPVVDLPIEGHSFEVRPEVRLSRPFGLSSWQTSASFRHLHLRQIRPGETPAR